MWLRVPSTMAIELTGTLPQNISAKDIILFILGQIGSQGAIGKVLGLKFRGDIIDRLLNNFLDRIYFQAQKTLLANLNLGK